MSGQNVSAADMMLMRNVSVHICILRLMLLAYSALCLSLDDTLLVVQEFALYVNASNELRPCGAFWECKMLQACFIFTYFYLSYCYSDILNQLAVHMHKCLHM